MAIYQFGFKLPWNTVDVRGPVSSNTWHFEDTSVGGMTQTKAETIANLCGQWYSPDGETIMGSMLSGVAEWAVLNLDDPVPRTAEFVGQEFFTASGDTLPGEVAAMVSYGRQRTSGVPAQRYRSRFNLGPLAQNAIGSDGLLADLVVDALAAQVAEFTSGVDGAGVTWVVGGSAFGFLPVQGGRIRNECSTVGRRQFANTRLESFGV